ncbi:MAG: tripartite tricarboxylate transporter substrate binding protein [Casimicrobiaceae bacterium]
MKLISNLLLLSTFVAATLGFCASASAQRYPTHPVRLVVPYSPGTATDVLARTVAEKLGEAWGQAVVVDNQPGANGTIATATVAKAAPDGYTLIMIAANHVINASLYKNLPYDDVKDFRALARIGQAAFVLCVNPALPVKTLGDLVALAKQQPGKLNYASPGNGTPGHLAMEMIKTLSGADIAHVPYRGAAQANTDLVGGQVQLGFVVESSAIPMIKAGKLRAIAMSSAARSRQLPDVPTVAESGYPGFDVVSWIGLAGPAQLPADLVAMISADTAKVLNTAEVQGRITGLGLTAFPAAADEFGGYLVTEHAKWAKAVKDSGATID